MIRMTVPGGDGHAVETRVRAELRSLRADVSGVHGAMVATSDGLLVAHDLPGFEPARVAALIATTLGLARQATEMTGRGEFREAVVRGGLGYLAVFAVGGNAVLAVIGDNDLNIGILHYQIRGVIERITAYAAEFRRFGAGPKPPSVETAESFLHLAQQVEPGRRDLGPGTQPGR